MRALTIDTPKKVNDVLTVTVDLSQWLAPTNDTVSTCTPSAQPSSMTVSGLTIAPTKLTFNAGGGAAGELHRIDLAFTTAKGQASTASIFWKVVA